MRLVWNSSLETGLRQIDLQHEELIGIINALQDILDSGAAGEAAGPVLTRLGNYILFHFGTEENLMRGLPGHRSDHLAEHRAFVARFDTLRQSASLTEASLNALVDYLNTWLATHIQQTDRALAKELLQNRLAGGAALPPR